MPRRRRRGPKKPKPVRYELIDKDSIVGHPMYALLAELVDEHHTDITRARIALAWCTSWKPDVDGRVTLGKCKKASDLDRELADYDFIILLSRLFWTSELTNDTQRRALLDHELTHATVKYGDDGSPARDERDRIVFRIRRHDIEEFTDVVARYGLWKRDLETFAVAVRRAALEPFVACENCRDELPGWTWVTDDKGEKRRKRCACWAAWKEHRTDAGPQEKGA